ILLTQADIINTFIVKKIIDIFSTVGTQLTNLQPIRFIFAYEPLKIYYDFTGKKEIFDLVILIAVIVFINMTFKGIFVYIKEYTLNSAVLKSLRDIRQDLYKRIITYPMKFYDQNKTGDLMAKITNDVSMVEGTFNTFIAIITDLVQSLFFLFLMFYLNWKLSLLVILMFPITGYIMKKFAIPIRKAQHKIVENISNITSFLQETLSGIKVIKIFVKEKQETGKFCALTQSTYSRNMKSVKLIALQKPLNELASIIGVLVVILFSGSQMLNGSITIGDFGRFILVVTMVYKPLKGLSNINTAIQKAIASGTRIFELMDNRDTETRLSCPKKNRAIITNIEGRVDFRNVSFEYKPKQPILHRINFTANAGEVIAIVGHSGSGKTTIVNLIPKFYNILKGKILIDRIDLATIDYTALRQFIAMVPQDTFLFSGTIRENIAYAREDATEEEIQQAAEHANAHKFIKKLKKEYNTEVGEKGVQLSGGEKQRISIARAILKDPRILILDEATSALDTESEILVQQALNYLMKNRTTFVIAHRLSTIQNANRILVMEDGNIIQTGTHRELIKAKKGLYYKLCNAQKLFK
ncbi:MAG: ABC transporter ATP-binding protein/permease, partial [Spirochaetes bacterium]|nr:ABC transporter ATP-binding protein/permease [Spirochaetota bacterium]